MRDPIEKTANYARCHITTIPGEERVYSQTTAPARIWNSLSGVELEGPGQWLLRGPVTRKSVAVREQSAAEFLALRSERLTGVVRVAMSRTSRHHLHGQPTALKACCVVSKSWVPRTRKHLFARIEFHAPTSPIEQWKNAFPDPPSSLRTHSLLSWPSSHYNRGSGCRQLDSRLPPCRNSAFEHPWV